MDKSRERTIRSFVKRTGRMTEAQSRALDSLRPLYGVDYSPQPLDFTALFGAPAPVVLEIGFGNGETLVAQALQNPDRHYVGIEVHEPGVGHCLLEIERTGIRNLRVIAHDAIEVLANQVPDASLARINLYFPDPWPKKRHHKRRIVRLDFLRQVASKLGPGGELFIATDWAEYAEHIDETCAGSGLFEFVERREHSGDAPIDRPTTKFERRGLRRGHCIVDWRLRLI
jgi:tRNA (guanine-N7-)-methyltransferase